MAHPPTDSSALVAERTWRTPRNFIVAGLTVNLLAAVIAVRLDETLIPLRVGLILTGLVLALVAVIHRLRNFVESIEERFKTVTYLAMGSCTVLLAYRATDQEWDTFRLVLRVLACTGLAGAPLVVMPILARRVVILLLVLFHFGGILTAVFSVPPPGGPQCWLAGTLWTYIYRPYLQFTFLTGSYHYFAPEPGPATQLWFRITYADPAVRARWVQIPKLQDMPNRLLYSRYTEMTKHTYTASGGYPSDFFAPKGRLWARMQERSKIPYHPDSQPNEEATAPDLSQYCEPDETSSKKYIASYARHVANDPEYRNPDCPDLPAKTVKVYRVLHRLLTPKEMVEGMSPEDPTKFLPVYMGEFDAAGTLINPDDPLLYWVVPILRQRGPDGGYVVKDYVAVHAGDTPLAGQE